MHVKCKYLQQTTVSNEWIKAWDAFCSLWQALHCSVACVCVWRSSRSWLIHKLDTTWPDIYTEPTLNTEHDTGLPRWSQYSHTLHCQLPGTQYKIRTIPVTETRPGEDAINLGRVDNFLRSKETLRSHQDNHEDDTFHPLAAATLKQSFAHSQRGVSH